MGNVLLRDLIGIQDIRRDGDAFPIARRQILHFGTGVVGDDGAQAVADAVVQPLWLDAGDIDTSEDDFDRAGFDRATDVLIGLDTATVEITGFDTQRLVVFQKRIWNGHTAGRRDLILPHRSLGSLALNRLVNANGQDIVIQSGEAAMISFDIVSNIWRVTPCSM